MNVDNDQSVSERTVYTKTVQHVHVHAVTNALVKGFFKNSVLS